MSDTINITVQWHEQTCQMIAAYQISLPWKDTQPMEVHPDTTIEEFAIRIAAMWRGMYERAYQEPAQMQVRGIFNAKDPQKSIKGEVSVKQYFASGDTAIAEALFRSNWTKQLNEYWNQVVRAQHEATMQNQEAMRKMQEEAIAAMRKELRFELNDRVVCNIGPRWLSGHVVGTCAEDPEDEDILPYLVKTDPVPGLESRTISAPYDSDDVVTQEVCFDRRLEMDFVRACAPFIPESKQSRLRFKVGDQVACRIKNTTDGLENWSCGLVGEVWPKLPGPHDWDLGEANGEFAKTVPYKVDLDCNESELGKGNNWVYCHADNHTLIRRAGLQPQIRVKGVSKRIEIRTLSSGQKEKFDHVTERGKIIALESESDSDSD